MYKRQFLNWDESTGTQIVFLYNEIKDSFQGDASLTFQTCLLYTSRCV